MSNKTHELNAERVALHDRADTIQAIQAAENAAFQRASSERQEELNRIGVRINEIKSICAGLAMAQE